MSYYVYGKKKCPGCKQAYDSVDKYGGKTVRGYGSPIISCPYCGTSFYDGDIKEYCQDYHNVDEYSGELKYDVQQSLNRMAYKPYVESLIKHNVNVSKYALENASDKKISPIAVQPPCKLTRNWMHFQDLINALDEYISIEYSRCYYKGFPFNDKHDAVKAIREQVFFDLKAYFKDAISWNKETPDSLICKLEVLKLPEGSSVDAKNNGPSFVHTFCVYDYLLFLEYAGGMFQGTYSHLGQCCGQRFDQYLLNSINKSFPEKQTVAKQTSAFSTSTEYYGELRQLKQLYDDGIITKEEFSAKKKQLLGI